MHPKLLAFIETHLILLTKHHYLVDDSKDIPYGAQYVFSKGSENIIVNFYYSEKKGCSIVVQGSSKNPLKRELEGILNQQSVTNRPSNLAWHNWGHWIGSDESGKGDYFGALVVCSVYIQKEQLPLLQKLHVRDSKQMIDKEVMKVAPALYKALGKQIQTLVLKPGSYNELYKQFTQSGKKLNELLAWMHSKTILELYNQYQPDGVLVDKFAQSGYLKKILNLPNGKLLEKTGGEADYAVAAASIIARYQFILQMESQSEFFQLNFPKGAGPGVMKAGVNFIHQYGAERLNEVAKVHFVTTEKIKGKAD